MLRLEGLGKRYGAHWALREVTLTANRGEMLVLLGPSGAGKSTLIRLIAGIEKPDTGRILIDDCDLQHLPPERRLVSTMWQSLSLFPHLNVVENVAFGLRAHGCSRTTARQRASELLLLVGLSGYEQRSIMSLSGGEQQRVALVRCLAVEPRVLLLDEPLGSLDERLRYELAHLLRSLHRKSEQVFLMVTHRLTEALACADRLAVMFDGSIEAIDKPDLVYSEPASTRVANFLGRNNVFAVLEAESLGDGCKVETELGTLFAKRCAAAADGVNSFYVISPSEIQISASVDSVPPGWNSIDVVLEETFYEGDDTRLRLANGRARIEVEVRNRHSAGSFVIGGRYCAYWPPSAAFCRIAGGQSKHSERQHG